VSDNGANPYKPKTVFCRRAALMRWTGWSDEEINYFVSTGRLRVIRTHPGAYRRFYVASAQEIIDE